MGTTESKYPYDARSTPFVAASIDNNDVNSINDNDMLCILGGSGDKQTSFIQLQCLDFNTIKYTTSMVNYKSSQQLSQTDLALISNMSNGHESLSFLIKNDKTLGNCIFVIDKHAKFNIYSLHLDRWSFTDSKQIFDKWLLGSPRGLLFDQS